MFTTIIMMNIKNIFITTGISVLFGVYSIYNIFEYLRVLNNHQVKQINSLQNLLNETNKKYNDLQVKYVLLQKNYDKLTVSHEENNNQTNLLNIQIIKLQEDKTIDTNNISNENSNENSNSTTYNNIICDLNSEIPIVNMENINSINIHEEFVESLFLEYDYLETGEASSLSNSEKCPIKSRTTDKSMTEINWTNLTKKFLFG